MSRATVNQPPVPDQLAASAMPQELLQWQLQERRDIFGALERGEFPRSFGSHLPAVNTLSSGLFPIHCANKGVGLTPTDTDLPELLAQLTDCLRWCQQREWPQTQPERIAAARLLYDHPDRIDPRRFGLIEIFRGQTYRNLCERPQASLLFTGTAPEWRSYQVNCTVELVQGDDPRFQFILAMRALFERDRFHIQQPDYPVGYLCWVQETIDKQPRHGHAGCPLSAGPKSS